MDSYFKNFYEKLYSRTGGFVPSKPLNQNMYPGDFFQIINGEMIVLGNIFRNNIINKDDYNLEYGIKQNAASWNFSEGISKPYSLRDVDKSSGRSFKYSKQLIGFKELGSFFFKSNNVESIKISDWSNIKNQLIIKMTQVLYSFRELYIVTESAVASDWTLAISGSEKGELELATEEEIFGLIDLFGSESAKTIQARDIEYYHRETKKNPIFFKAKKLVVKQEKLEVFISELISNRRTHSDWVDNFFDYDFESTTNESTTNESSPSIINSQSSILDMLQANELNPNTALLYFDWADINLDDVEKLFPVYGV
nr:hypothetical protein [uncultured Psychroserpens sp.]